MNTKVKAACVACLSIIFLACINTRYSRTDETEITTNITYLILGEFAHHGTAFYDYEVEKNLKELKSNPKDFDARNDLASAYTKLARYDEAEKEFLLNEELHPGKYKTASNLGVLYKKMGQYKKASDAIKRALAIKPGGHMGLGDYYLRMIDWLDKYPYYNSKVEPKENFLGIPYSASPKEVAEHKLVNRKHLETLIKNDYKFADTYIVLGDLLFHNKDYQMALRAYSRAENLNHPNNTMVYERIKMIHNHFANNPRKGYVLDFRSSQISREFDSAAEWLGKFQEIEADELKAGRPVDFKTLLKVADKSGLKHTKVMDAIQYAGITIDGKRSDFMIIGPAIFLVLAAVVLGFFLIRAFGSLRKS